MKSVLLVLLLVMFVLTIGCGDDGNPGKAFISFGWDEYAAWYEDTNPATPEDAEGIYPNTDYSTEPGSYSFEYGCWDQITNETWMFEGSYEITVNEGEKGGLFSSGGDGADSYFEMFLGGNGPNFSQLEKSAITKTCLMSENQSHNRISVGDVQIITKVSGNKTMTVVTQKYKVIN